MNTLLRRIVIAYRDNIDSLPATQFHQTNALTGRANHRQLFETSRIEDRVSGRKPLSHVLNRVKGIQLVEPYDLIVRGSNCLVHMTLFSGPNRLRS